MCKVDNTKDDCEWMKLWRRHFFLQSTCISRPWDVTGHGSPPLKNKIGSSVMSLNSSVCTKACQKCVDRDRKCARVNRSTYIRSIVRRHAQPCPHTAHPHITLGHEVTKKPLCHVRSSSPVHPCLRLCLHIQYFAAQAAPVMAGFDRDMWYCACSSTVVLLINTDKRGNTKWKKNYIFWAWTRQH